MLPEMIPVDSSNIEAIGYDADHRELYVRFIEGNTYAYSDAPIEAFDEFLRSPSKGSFFNRAIRNTYAYRQV